MMPSYDPNYLFWPIFQPKIQSSSMIPKIIHQLWLGPNPPTNLMETWKKLNPDWAYILWTEENLKNWAFKNKKYIDEMIEPNGKCDIMRYEILYHMGGFFIDADTICIQPLDDRLFQYECISVFESEKHRGGLIACGFMAARPGCKLLKLCIENLAAANSPAWWYVGPAYFTHIVQKYKYPIKIHPSHYFIPKHYEGKMYTGDDAVFCDHLWGNTFGDYERFTHIQPLKIQEPKSRQHQPKIPGNRTLCRRLGIGCQLRHMKQVHELMKNQKIGDQPCSLKPSTAIHAKRAKSPS